MRTIIIVIAISVILGLSVAVGFNLMSSGSKPSTPPKQTKSYEISVTDQLLMKIEKRLEYIQKSLAQLEETGTQK